MATGRCSCTRSSRPLLAIHWLPVVRHHSADIQEAADYFDIRAYIPEPQRAERMKLSDKLEGQRRAVLNNRRRMKRAKSKALQRRRSEVVERGFVHVCETFASRRTWLSNLADVTKRYLTE